MNIRHRQIVLWVSICFSVNGWADVYKYVDEDGRVHFVDNKAMHGAAAENAKKVELKIKQLTAEEKQAAAEGARRLEAQQLQRREQANAVRSSSNSANNDNNRRNCRYYKDKLANAKQRKTDLKLSGYTIGQKESAESTIRDMRARVRQYCR